MHLSTSERAHSIRFLKTTATTKIRKIFRCAGIESMESKIIFSDFILGFYFFQLLEDKILACFHFHQLKHFICALHNVESVSLTWILDHSFSVSTEQL